MKYLVIGSKGFIGTAVVNHFSGIGIVAGADILQSDSPNYFKIIDNSFNRSFETFKPDVCINASGSAHVGFSFTDPKRDRELNALNVERLIQSLLRYSPACKFLNFSSAAVYGNPPTLPVKENSPLEPLSPYGKHKLEAEQIIAEYSKTKGLRASSLRVFSAYGPGLRKQLFWDIALKCKQDPNVLLFGTGEESRDFIYISDLVNAVECISRSAPMNGESINVATGTSVSIKEAANLFLSAFTKDYSVQFNGEVREGDPLQWKADISFLSSLGFKQLVSLKAGLQNYAKWVKSEG